MTSLCLQGHSKNYWNYPWLNHIHGGLNFILYEEPVGSGKWRAYTDETWEAHCNIVDHKPCDLVQAHVNAFINPSTRFARLLFVFTDGTQCEPIVQFYELEAAWFAKYSGIPLQAELCSQGGKCICGPSCKCGPNCSC